MSRRMGLGYWQSIWTWGGAGVTAFLTISQKGFLQVHLLSALHPLYDTVRVLTETATSCHPG